MTDTTAVDPDVDGPEATALPGGDRMKISDLLDFAITASARQSALKDTLDDVRVELCRRGAEVYERDGAVPTWRHPDGTIPVSRSDDSLAVADRPELMSWLAQQYPDHFAGTITISIDDDLAESMADVTSEYAGVTLSGTITVGCRAQDMPAIYDTLAAEEDGTPVEISSRLDVDPTWLQEWFDGVAVHEVGGDECGADEDDHIFVDPSGLAVPAGLLKVTPGGAFTVSIRATKDAKARARAQVDAELSPLHDPAPSGYPPRTAVSPGDPVPVVAVPHVDDAGDEPDRDDPATRDAAGRLVAGLDFYCGDDGLDIPAEDLPAAAALVANAPAAVVAALTKDQLALVLTMLGAAVPANLGSTKKADLQAVLAGLVGNHAKAGA